MVRGQEKERARAHAQIEVLQREVSGLWQYAGHLQPRFNLRALLCLRQTVGNADWRQSEDRGKED